MWGSMSIKDVLIKCCSSVLCLLRFPASKWEIWGILVRFGWKRHTTWRTSVKHSHKSYIFMVFHSKDSEGMFHWLKTKLCCILRLLKHPTSLTVKTCVEYYCMSDTSKAHVVLTMQTFDHKLSLDLSMMMWILWVLTNPGVIKRDWLNRCRK